MAKFILSAFSDEYSSNFDEQIVGLNKNNVGCMEIRGVDGKNVASLSADEARVVKAKLDGGGIKISSIGSPIGKIKLTDDYAKHLDVLKNVCETASILGTDRVRMFSFYLPGDDIASYKNEVIEKIGAMLDVADKYKMSLCHENEKGIYGDIPSRCLELIEAFDGRLKCVFDHANFIQCDSQPYPDGFELLKNHICYMHIKDAEADGQIAVAGKGIGRITETLRELNKMYDSEMILTVEPHLKVFAGLSDLEGGERTKLKNTFATNEEAFAAAVAGLRECIGNI
jgi:Xylose isomerase-like TIM barrel.